MPSSRPMFLVRQAQCPAAGRRAPIRWTALLLGLGLLLQVSAVRGQPAKNPLAGKIPASSDYTAEQMKEIQELLKEAEKFAAQSDGYRKTVNGIVRRSYEQRKKDLLTSYEKKIRDQEVEERNLRISAITLFEDFLRRYPNDIRWTPDVIFRLAELYFEKAHDEYLTAEESYQKTLMNYELEVERFKKGEIASSPAVPQPPRQDYTQTIMLHRKLIREFPGYRFLDGAYYLLGFCLMEMANEEEGNQALLSLVCSNHFRPPLTEKPASATTDEPGEAKTTGGAATSAMLSKLAEEGSILKPKLDVNIYDDCVLLYPKSRFNAESWIRIGEFHFDMNEFGAAIAAYRRVLDLGPKDNAYYDEALYKLAWTYYRADRFMDSIQHFDKLVVYADQEYERTGKAGSEMRPEALKYLGISFAEEDWDGDTQPDAETGLQRIEAFYAQRGGEKHVYEVYRLLADIYYDTNKYEDAVKVYKLLLQRWPMRPTNPEVQDRIIVALERQQKFDDAMGEREEFSRLFGKGTDWEKSNRNDAKALKNAQDYDEQALIKAAIYHHTRGKNLKSKGAATNDIKLLEEATQEYAIAAKAYEKYLERFPNTKNSYEIKYSYASCLYFSQRFPEAAVVFGEVRDSNLDNRYQEDSAFSATKAYEEYINNLVRQGQLPNPPLPKADQPPASLASMTLPDPYKKWQEALDAYAKVLPTSAKTPNLVYKAAEIPYRFLNFEDARKRFEEFIAKNCKDPLAASAGQAILVTYQLEKNMDKMLEWATKLQDSKCGKLPAGVKPPEGMPLVPSDQTPLIFALKFKKAEELMNNKKFDEAATAFLALVDAYPSLPDTPLALNNAAVCYENSKRFESASKLYERLWKSYPDSKFADEALWRTALNYQQFFEFSDAVNIYQILADEAKYAKSPHRADAIYNAAVILENDQNYSKAGQQFERYAQLKGQVEDAAEAYFRAGLIYKKMGDVNNMIRIFRDFPKLYGGVAGQERRIVEGQFLIAEFYDQRGDWRQASKYYAQTIREFSSRGLKPASDAAEFAAQSEFLLMEKKLEVFLKAKISGAINTIPKRQEEMAKQALALKNEYEKIWNYKRARWTLAAMYRSGTIYEHFARAMNDAYRNAPIPANVKRLGKDAEEMYLSQIDELLVEKVDPIMAQAKALYKACIDRAKEFGVSNKYTEEALRKLNTFDPITYPLLKQAKVEYSLD